MKVKSILIAAAAGALLLGSSATAVLAVGSNGTFEIGTDPGMYATLPPASTNITDWRVDSGSVDYIGTYWGGSNGPRSVDLNGLTTGSISQSLVTVAGATYKITFDLSGNPDSRPQGDPLYSPSNKVVTVNASGGGSPVDFNYDTSVELNSLGAMKWKGQTYSFVATGTSSTLSFTSKIPGAFGPAIDNVVIEETIPEPVELIDCPEGTTKTLIDTKTVNSALSTDTLSSEVLSSGGTYLLVSSGTWENVGKNLADTEYTSIDNWTTHMDGYNIPPYSLGEGEFDLQVDGAFVDWGSYNASTHEYSHLYTGTGNAVKLLIFDGDSTGGNTQNNPGWYGDNNGSLTVKIYSCNKPTGSLMVTKNTIGGDGTFDFTGVSGGFSVTTVGGTGTASVSDLTPGTYSVAETPKAGWNLTSNLCGAVVVLAGETASCTITNTKQSSISGYKYNDRNRNGKRDNGEEGLPGWVIRLKRGNVVVKDTTDADGFYSFNDLSPGTYKVRETHKNGWKRISKNPKPIVIAQGDEVTEVNFGNVKKHWWEHNDDDRDDDRDEQDGHFYPNGNRCNYDRDKDKKDFDHRDYRGRRD